MQSEEYLFAVGLEAHRRWSGRCPTAPTQSALFGTANALAINYSTAANHPVHRSSKMRNVTNFDDSDDEEDEVMGRESPALRAPPSSPELGFSSSSADSSQLVDEIELEMLPLSLTASPASSDESSLFGGDSPPQRERSYSSDSFSGISRTWTTEWSNASLSP